MTSPAPASPTAPAPTAPPTAPAPPVAAPPPSLRTRWRAARRLPSALLAIVGPALVALLTVFVIARPSDAAFAVAGGVAAAVVVADVIVVLDRRRLIGVAALVTHGLLAALLATYRAAPLAAPPPLLGDLPAASPPADMSLAALPTGVIHRTAAFAYRGGSPFDRRDFAMTAVLVRHPQGDLLIDTGLGRELDAQLPRMPRRFRAVSRIDRGRPAAEQLAAAGHDRARLRGILLTHAHWDHVSGVPDFPGVPVLVTAEEQAFIADGGWITAIARSATAARYQTYPFDGGPYLGFARSHDVYGDGAIVVVPAPGHTPGSVIVFVALPDGRRYAFVGDLCWQREGIVEREERPWLVRREADHDPAAVRVALLRMAAIAARFPTITLVPAHDARALAELPTL